MWYNSTGVCGGAGGGAGVTNSSQFKVVGVANSVTRRASLMVMCLFTGFVRDKNHKSYPVHYCFKPQWISPEMIHEGRLAIYMYKCGKMWLTLKFADFVLAIDVDNADRFRLCGVVICAGCKKLCVCGHVCVTH